MASKTRPTLDLLIVTGATVSRRSRCPLCEAGFVDGEVAFRVRDHDTLVDHLWHRRCVEGVMDDGPIDYEQSMEEFHAFRRSLLRVVS